MSKSDNGLCSLPFEYVVFDAIAFCFRTAWPSIGTSISVLYISILLPNLMDYSRTFGLNLDAFVPFCFALRENAECSALIKIEENYFLLQCNDISLC